jgi:hypothetical protein
MHAVDNGCAGTRTYFNGVFEWNLNSESPYWMIIRMQHF